MKKTFFLLIVITIISLFHYQLFAQQPKEKTTSTQKQGTPKKNAFGFDIGIGSLCFKEQIIRDDAFSIDYFDVAYNYPVFAVGIRYMHHFNPYIGADFFKFNLNCPVTIMRDRNLMNVQLMTGIRGNTPTFFKTMSGFGVARLGYGLQLSEPQFGHGFAFEAEAGLNMTQTFFIAFSYNLLSRFKVLQYGYISESEWKYGYMGTAAVYLNTYTLRIGFNF